MCPSIYDEKTIERLWNEGKDWDSHCKWEHIDSTKFIFNRELIEIVETPVGSDYDIDLYRIMSESTCNLAEF